MSPHLLEEHRQAFLHLSFSLYSCPCSCLNLVLLSSHPSSLSSHHLAPTPSPSGYCPTFLPPPASSQNLFDLADLGRQMLVCPLPTSRLDSCRNPFLSLPSNSFLVEASPSPPLLLAQGFQRLDPEGFQAFLALEEAEVEAGLVLPWGWQLQSALHPS